MKKKLSLELESLAVDSFETSAANDGHGTVHGQAALAPQPTPPEYADCTCAYSCLCKTAYYHCGTGHYTIYSCDYTANASCKVTNAGYSCELPCTG
jgi:hypothetical protein